MSLIVETGQIVANAETYVDVTSADTYHGNRSNAAWAAAATPAKEAALRKAAAYLDGHYRNRWKGQKTYPITQPMEWPRVGVRVVDTPQPFYDVPSSFYDSAYSGFLAITSIPQRLKDAQCELALRALSGDLAADVDASVQSEKVDVLETTYRSGVLPGQIAYQVVDQLLSDYLKPSNSCDLVRG